MLEKGGCSCSTAAETAPTRGSIAPNGTDWKQREAGWSKEGGHQAEPWEAGAQAEGCTWAGQSPSHPVQRSCSPHLILYLLQLSCRGRLRAGLGEVRATENWRRISKISMLKIHQEMWLAMNFYHLGDSFNSSSVWKKGEGGTPQSEHNYPKIVIDGSQSKCLESTGNQNTN